MEKESLIFRSVNLKRNVHVNIYGYFGVPIILIPKGDSESGLNDIENKGIIPSIQNYIDRGKIKVFCVEDDNGNSLFRYNLTNEKRSENLNNYKKFIIQEILPLIYKRNNRFELPYIMGYYLGGALASMVFFAEPKLFAGVISLDGMYDLTYFFDDWVDKNLYQNSPLLFIRDTALSNPLFSNYTHKKIILCIGQSNKEEIIETQFNEFRKILTDKRISAWFDYWGESSSPNYEWWSKQIAYFIPFIIDEK